MGYKIYGEPEPVESPWSEFWIGLFIGAIGFPMQIGWVFVSLGWMSGRSLLLIGVLIGCVLGANMAWLSYQRKQKNLHSILSQNNRRRVDNPRQHGA